MSLVKDIFLHFMYCIFPPRALVGAVVGGLIAVAIAFVAGESTFTKILAVSIVAAGLLIGVGMDIRASAREASSIKVE